MLHLFDHLYALDSFRFCSILLPVDSFLPPSLSPKSWIEEKKMGAFLGVAQGAATSPWLLEMRYNYNPEDTPIVLVGKGNLSCTLLCTDVLMVIST